MVKLLYIHKIYPFACNNVPSVKGVKEAQEARRGNQGREVTQILSVMCANLSECFSGSWTISMSLFKVFFCRPALFGGGDSKL
jgi:hypothetical protein